MLHSIYDLTTFCQKTTGDVPPKLVGASTTVVGSKMYLFGGRLVSERRMVADLYVFDLETFVWEKIPASPDDDVPRHRYFHSTDLWNNHLIVFGGMSTKLDSDDLCVINDVRFYNISTRRWLPSVDFSSTSEQLIPRARYAHLSSVTADRLFIIGGQDFFNTWLDDVCVFDLVSKTWVQRRDYPRHCGTYRSVALCSNTTIRSPQDEMQASLSSSTLGPSGSRFTPSRNPNSSPHLDNITPSEKLIHLPYSATPTEDHPADIYLYSNYNFTDVKRELEVFSPLPDADFTIQDRSSAMTGNTFPPGLRFPTGAILGNHLIIAGTYLAHSYQSFSIWVLDLTSMTWSRIDPGKAIETGSWFRGCLWPEANKFLIFGNTQGNLVDDYNHRLLSWSHVAVVDLEAFGIYQPPPLKLDIRMQELGLAALEEQVLADFEIICDDGRRIPCSRRMLEDRWPWFKEQRKQLLKAAKATLESLPTSPMHVPLPDLNGNVVTSEPRVDPRLTPRALQLSEPYSVALGLLQYFYSLALVTPLQHTPAVLSQLLILSANYRITHLEYLVKHAMHCSLSNSTAVGVYEVATLCSCRSLQIRALKTVMSYTQKRSSRRERESSNGGAEGTGGGKYISRPRGTSDAKWRDLTDSGASSSYTVRNNNGEDPIPSAATPVPVSTNTPADTNPAASVAPIIRPAVAPTPMKDPPAEVANLIAARNPIPVQNTLRQTFPSVPVTALAPRIRRPATADANVPTTTTRAFTKPISMNSLRPSTANSLPYISSAEDIRSGDLINRRVVRTPDTSFHNRQVSLTQSTSGGGTYTSPRTRLGPIQTVSNDRFPQSPPSVLSATATLSDSQNNMSFRESQVTVVESDTGATDEEYHVLTKEEASPNFSEPPGIPKPDIQGGARTIVSNWPKQASTVKWLEHTANAISTASPPGSSTSPRSATPSSNSGGSSFTRFLSRPVKDRSNSVTDDDVSSNAPATTKLVEIKSQIAHLEEERKRLKKEAKIRALLSQGGPVGVYGGGMMG